MSSRGSFVLSGPQSGVYVPRPTPANAENLPVYLNDEFMNLGGLVNNILEGGAFPPQSELPKRVKEGMMIFFTQRVKNERYDASDENSVEYIIPSSGVWLYRNNQWWKMIDDPVALIQTLTVYKQTEKGAVAPGKPPANKYLEKDLNGWVFSPFTNSATKDQWISVAANANLSDPVDVSWGEPIKFNAQGDIGQPGEDGYTTEFRYFSSTSTPALDEPSSRIPETGGKVWSLNPTPVEHPNNSFVWSIYSLVRPDGMQGLWSNPVKYSTPDSTKAASAYQSARGAYQNFNPNASGLPGPNWLTSTPESIPTGNALWRTDRLEWTDGSPQTAWSTPYRANGELGNTTEVRYIASTKTPDIESKTARKPETSSGELYTLDIPSTEIPDKVFIWATSSVINAFEEAVGWSSPVKYASPNSTEFVDAYAIGTATTFPTFVDNAPDLPGSNWSYTQPEVGVGSYLWMTSRSRWVGGEALTNWSHPLRVSAVDGVSYESRYKASSTKPVFDKTLRNPEGWTLEVPSVTGGVYVWVITATISATANTLVGGWSDANKYSTPNNSTLTAAYQVARKDFNNFNPDASGVPGANWYFEIPEEIPTGYTLWKTERRQWSDGTPQTPWAYPYKANGGTVVTGESRYIASTEQPDIVDEFARVPETSSGVEYTTDVPSVSHPDKTYIWVTTTWVDELEDVMGWTDPVKYATPDALFSMSVFAKGTASAYPSFSPTASGLPGSAWFYERPTTAPGEYIWETSRQQWSDGTGATVWATPIRLTSVDGNFSENRYIASATKPILVVSTRYPSGWTLEIPQATGSQLIWATRATVNPDDALITNWSDPVKFSTPNTTEILESYALGTPTRYPSFNPTGTTPGAAWSTTPPAKDKGQAIWVSKRIVFSDGTPQTSWTTPVVFSGVDGEDGTNGSDGNSLYTWIKYADTATGSGMSDSPTGKSYMGVAYNNTTPVESTVASLYTWSLIKGTNGTNGTNGSTIYVEFQFSANGSSWHFPEQSGDRYLRSRTVTNGVAGAWGATTDLKGTAGEDGVTTYTWIKYADTAVGGGMSDSPTNKEYIGFAYNKTTATESTVPEDYSWSLIKGADGTNGTNGSTIYTEFQFSSDKVDWHFPDVAGDRYMRSRKVTNGSASAWGSIVDMKGEDGKPGTNGSDGRPGAGFYSLPWAGFNGTWPTNAVVDAQFVDYFGFTPIRDDVLTIVNPSNATISATRRRDSSNNWVVSTYFHGDMITSGTITGNRLVAGTSISAPIVLGGKLSGGSIFVPNETSPKFKVTTTGRVEASDILITNGSLTAPTISGGSLNIGSGKFVVSTAGALTATSATITGNVTATSGSIGGFTIGSGKLTGGTIESGTINSGQINIGNGVFRVLSSGALTATSATISGSITATSGKVGGWTINSNSLSGAGTISGGTISGSTVSGGTISGATITASTGIALPNTTSPKFSVNATTGVMTATGAVVNGSITATSGKVGGFTIESNKLSGAGLIQGGTISGSTISGGSINISNGKFSVNTAGVMSATGATVSGVINATSGSFSGNITSTATITGGTISGSNLRGGNIKIGGTDANPNFYVDPSGNLFANNGRFEGEVTAEGVKGAVGSAFEVDEYDAITFPISGSGGRATSSGNFVLYTKTQPFERKGLVTINFNYCYVSGFTSSSSPITGSSLLSRFGDEYTVPRAGTNVSIRNMMCSVRGVSKSVTGLYGAYARGSVYLRYVGMHKDNYTAIYQPMGSISFEIELPANSSDQNIEIEFDNIFDTVEGVDFGGSGYNYRINLGGVRMEANVQKTPEIGDLRINIR